MIQISFFTAVLILFIVNIILEHLINWGIRESEQPEIRALLIIAWLFKTILIIIFLYEIFE